MRNMNLYIDITTVLDQLGIFSKVRLLVLRRTSLRPWIHKPPVSWKIGLPPMWYTSLHACVIHTK